MDRTTLATAMLIGLVGLSACQSSDTDKEGPSSASSEVSTSSSSSQTSSSSASLLINEIVAKSDDATYLAGNDWFELYNNGSATISLDNYSVSDDSGLPQNLPQLSLAPGEYLVIAAVDAEDVDPPQPSVPFKLGSSDSLNLHLDSDVVHTLSWVDGDAEEGDSYGLVNGTAQTTQPTPGAANALPDPEEEPTIDSNLRISEIVAKSADDSTVAGNDWIELQNISNSAIDLGEYALADQSSDMITLPSSILNAGEYIVIAAVDADDLSPPTPNVPFKLGSEDSVLLYHNGVLVDRIDWVDGEAPEGSGFGLVDGELTTTTPTPNQANEAVSEPDPVTTSDLVINEVVAKSANDTFLAGNDWFELHNIGSSSISLGEFTIADSGNEPAALPAVILPPGGFLVIAAVDSDDTDPPSPSVPFKLGSADSLSLYSGSELVGFLSWVDGEAPEGSSYGILNGSEATLTPTPEEANQL